MFKARVEIPCFYNRCMVWKNGVEVQSMMRLAERTKRGERLDDPVYFCEREGCYYHDNPTLARHTRGMHITEDYRQLGPTGKKPGQEVPESYA